MAVKGPLWLKIVLLSFVLQQKKGQSYRKLNNIENFNTAPTLHNRFLFVSYVQVKCQIFVQGYVVWTENSCTQEGIRGKVLKNYRTS
jgi:hypothetical protein